MNLKRVFSVLLLLCLLVTAFPALAPQAKASSYTIDVDITNQIVTVYDSSRRRDKDIVRQMICSTGMSGHGTPTGTYSLPAKSNSAERTEWYYFAEYGCYAKWATRIKGKILFHSVLYSKSKKGPTNSSTKALGSKASHGCIRLRVSDAKWIAQHCGTGTKVRIFSSGKKDSTLRKKLLKSTFSRSSQSYSSFKK